MYTATLYIGCTRVLYSRMVVKIVVVLSYIGQNGSVTVITRSKNVVFMSRYDSNKNNVKLYSDYTNKNCSAVSQLREPAAARKTINKKKHGVAARKNSIHAKTNNTNRHVPPSSPTVVANHFHSGKEPQKKGQQTEYHYPPDHEGHRTNMARSICMCSQSLHPGSTKVMSGKLTYRRLPRRSQQQHPAPHRERTAPRLRSRAQ